MRRSRASYDRHLPVNLGQAELAAGVLNTLGQNNLVYDFDGVRYWLC